MEKEVRDILLNVANREAEEIKKEARNKADEIMREAQREAERRLEAERSRLKAKLQVERSKRIGEAERIAKEKILLAEHKIVEEVVKETFKELSKLRERGEEYRRVLTNLLGEALQDIEGGDIEVHTNPEDVALLEEILREKELKYRVISDKGVELGVVVYDTSRGFVVYNTLRNRLEKAKGILLENLKEVLVQM
jgi:V/A-type H+-transporting ATPase subunit E